ncbi:hypothetical protein FQR65_LT04727 [Abscondita terminalis]|nr:hypothetical protein FQR65_LT04727 [Abscondita terminalis]
MDDDYEAGWDGGDAMEDESDGGEDNVENPEQVLAECAEKFATPDYIMEPGIFSQLKRYFQSGGNPVHVIEQLSHNYTAVAQMANLIAEWLIIGGVKVQDVQAMVENHLKDMILRTFDPKKADTIFTEEGETPAWLTELIEHPTWRSLIYRLAEEYPDCLMLNFTIKLISDAGFQGEITSISTAAQQLEVFSRVLKTSIGSFLMNPEDWQKTSRECAKMVCHGQHTYVYSQVIMNVLAREPKGGSSMKRLSQEITKCAQKNGHDITPITMALNGASGYPQACQALTSMLCRNTLNPADISVLFRNYSAVDCPPIDLIRTHNFWLEMRKMVLDRMVNLLCAGCVVPVVKYIKQCWQKGDTDISLIRYFVTEVLEAIGPPYSSEFVHLFMPMVENDEITGTMRGDGDNDPVSEFIVYCKANYSAIM